MAQKESLPHDQGYGCLSSIDTSSCRFHFSLKSLNHTVLMPGLSSWQGQSLFNSSPLNIFVSEKDGLTVYDKTLL
ncbi:unnamed protein product [Sphagnum jensenii]